MAVPPVNFGPVLALSLVAWGMYRRIRRNIGQQPIQPKRMIARIVLFSVITLLIAAVSVFHPSTLVGLGAGILLGVPLALVGLRLTRFETTAAGRFYTPNTYIGMALSVLLVGRVAYRFLILSGMSQAFNPQTSKPFMQSPLTLSLFGLMAGYYVAYYTGLLLRSRRPDVP